MHCMLRSVMLIGLAFVLGTCGNALQAQSQLKHPTKVMSFNIRYGTANDGDNHWDKRKEFLLKTIQAFQPDLLGTQETLGFQRDFLRESLAGYGWLGVGRDDGKESGEMMALYYRLDRYDLLESGHFWLSESPETAGSKSWDAALPRMASWVRLQDKSNSRRILFINTHFDHKGKEARLQSAKLLRKKAHELKKDAWVIITGDFNAGAKSDPYQALFATDTQSITLRDTYRVQPQVPQGPEGTFSNFRENQTQGERIDWIAVSEEWKVELSKIDRVAREGRTPSDHFPVEAILQ